MPTSPNSLTITAMRRPCSDIRMRLSKVVLPAPRKPVRMMTEALLYDAVACCIRVCLTADRQLHLADHLADRLAVVRLHVAAHDCVDRHALDLPAAPRRRR